MLLSVLLIFALLCNRSTDGYAIISRHIGIGS